MAEQGGSSKGFSKVLSRNVFRTKEKFLHALGKADRTQDELFGEHVSNFGRQQETASKLSKELKSYVTCLKVMQSATTRFYTTIKETYEPDWTGYEDLLTSVESIASLWQDYLDRLQSEVNDPLSIYLAEFPEVKNRISKRERKLIDFDGARHNLESLESAKKQDELKINKARMDLRQAESVYHQINTDLHDSLPQLYDKRANVLAANFTALFTVEAKFLEESAKVRLKMVDLSDKLQEDSHRGMFASPRYRSSAHRNSDLSTDPVDLSNYETPRGGAAASLGNFGRRDNGASPTNRRNTSHTASNASRSSKASNEVKSSQVERFNNHHTDSDSSEEAGPPVPSKSPGIAHPEEEFEDPAYETVNSVSNAYETVDVIKQERTQSYVSKLAKTSVRDSGREPEVFDSIDSDDDDAMKHYKVPTSEPVRGVAAPLGANVLYKVQATHPYEGEDMDELTFEPGDLISVCPFPDPEDADDGWLYGIKEADGSRGVFPANFTKRL